MQGTLRCALIAEDFEDDLNATIEAARLADRSCQAALKIKALVVEMTAEIADVLGVARGSGNGSGEFERVARMMEDVVAGIAAIGEENSALAGEAGGGVQAQSEAVTRLASLTEQVVASAEEVYASLNRFRTTEGESARETEASEDPANAPAEAPTDRMPSYRPALSGSIRKKGFSHLTNAGS